MSEDAEESEDPKLDRDFIVDALCFRLLLAVPSLDGSDSFSFPKLEEVVCNAMGVGAKSGPAMCMGRSKQSCATASGPKFKPRLRPSTHLSIAFVFFRRLVLGYIDASYILRVGAFFGIFNIRFY